MAKTTFQGYARGQGFQQLKVPYNVLAQQQQRDQQVIRNLQTQQQQEAQRSGQYISDLERKFQREQANLAENQRIEDTYYAARREAIKQNQRVQQEDSQRRINAIEQTSKREQASYTQKQALAAMSPKLAEKLIGIKDAVDEAQMDAAYNQAIAEGIDIDREAIYENALQALVADSDGIQSFAEALEASGAPARVVRHIRDGDKSAEIGRLKAFTEMAKEGYGQFISRALIELEPNDAVETAQLLEKLQIEYLKSNNLYGLNADFLNPLFKEMRAVRNQQIIQAETQEIIAKDQTDLQNNKIAFIKLKEPQAMLNYFNAASRGYNEKGQRNTRTDGVNAVFTLLEDTSLFSNQELEDILMNTMTDQGQSWYERYPQYVDNLYEKRAEDRAKDRRIVEAELEAVKQQTIEETRVFLNNFDGKGWAGDMETFDKIMQDLQNLGVPIDQFKRYADQSVEARSNYKFWEDEIEALIKQSLLTPEYLSNTSIPKSLRDKYGPEALRLADIRKQRGMTDADIKSELQTELRTSLGSETIDNEFTGIKSATAFAFKLYNEQFAARAESVSPEKANNEALLYVRSLITDKKGKFKTQEYSTNVDSPTTTYFPEFSPQAGRYTKGVPVVPLKTKRSLLEAYKANPNLINTQLFIDQSLLDSIRMQIQNNQPVNIPAIYRDIAKFDVQKRTPAELLNIQLEKVGGYTERLSPGPQADLLKATDDPQAERFIRSIRTRHDQARATLLTYGGSRAPVFMNPSYVALTGEQTPVTRFRNAIITQESGASYGAVNPHSGAIGIGQVMPGNVASWTRQYYGRSLSTHEFRNNPEAQEAVINGRFRDMLSYYAQQGYAGEIMIRRAAAEWYGGRGNNHLYDDPAPQYYNGIAYPSFRDYTTNIWNMYQRGGQ